MLPDREVTPLFRDDAYDVIKASRWSHTLRAVLQTFMAVRGSERYSIHCFRADLACALHKAGASDADMRAVCRWRSVGSLRAYVRWPPEEYGDLLKFAHEQEVDPL